MPPRRAHATGSSPGCSCAWRSSASSRTCRGGRSSGTCAGSPRLPAESRMATCRSASLFGGGTSSRSSVRRSTTWLRSARVGRPWARPERRALVDGLTGLANRRAASHALHAEAARAKRLETPLSVVLADLDGFKEVNDEHGHAVGDAVLRVFAEVLRDTLRESDLAGRWGGEEFLLLLPGADKEGAAQLAERVRVGLAARRIPNLPELRVTASFGVAEYVGETNTEQLVAA